MKAEDAQNAEECIPEIAKKLKVVAFDPGGTTGVAAWDENLDLHLMDTYKMYALIDDLDEWLADIWVIEEYRIRPNVRHGGQKVETIQVIGALKGFARRNKIKVVEQPSSILPVAEKWTGQQMPKNHKYSHHVSAFLHGEYYMQKTGMKKPRILIELKKEKEEK